MRFKNQLLLILLLVFVNLIAHFVPFERASLSPDDYFFIQWLKVLKPTNLLDYFAIWPARPLCLAYLDMQHKIIQDNPLAIVTFIFLVSVFVLILIFFILKELFDNVSLAFLGTLIFSLLPNIIEIYHTPIYGITSNTAIGFYLSSLPFYIYFVKGGKNIYLFLSLFFYSLGVFSYEVGFFLPIILLAYSLLYSVKKSKWWYLFFFVIPALSYLIFRAISNSSFGNLITASSGKIIVSISPFIDLFHHFLGRYALRLMLYGIYKFFTIDPILLVPIISLDFILLLILASIFKKIELGKVDVRPLISSVIIFVAFLIPILLYGSGIAGRHLVLPAFGFAIFAVCVLQRLGKNWRIIFLSLTLLALVICQGNSWAQVIACRINGSVNETIKEMKAELTKAESVIIDTKSFADNIDFTWVKRNFNTLNTYYGAQVFEKRGLENMVRLAINDNNKPVYITTERPRFISDDLIEIQEASVTAYRHVLKKNITLPKRGAVIIDYKRVYGEDFNNGIRKRRNI